MATGYRSFSDPDTHFAIVISDTPFTVDGFKLGEPTGEVRCVVCEKTAGAPEYIPHEKTCPQRDVKSKWWVQTHVD